MEWNKEINNRGRKETTTLWERESIKRVGVDLLSTSAAWKAVAEWELHAAGCHLPQQCTLSIRVR